MAAEASKQLKSMGLILELYKINGAYFSNYP